jgi:GDSL-like Lipase/Acylhydrolase
MLMIRSLVRASAALALAGMALSCDHEASVFDPPPADDMFATYVAIGNSITAGVQSGGINDATQRQSYAFLIAQQMRTRFAYPSLTMPGCQPPIINWQTGARLNTPAPVLPGGCQLRSTTLATDILNNVAVPGAGSTEVNAPTSPFHNTLTSLFLGGKTQTQRALDARPGFVSIWIGNNDVLDAAVLGIAFPNPNAPARPITPVATFTAEYDAMLDAITANGANVEGILIGTVQTTAAPLVFPVAAFQDPAFLAGFGQLAGGPVSVHANCTGSPALVSFLIVGPMRAYNPANPVTPANHPRAIVCEKNTPGFADPVGDVYILDAADQAAIQTAVTQYNAHIQSKANELGWAYVDPNAAGGLIATLRASGCIRAVPNIGASATTSPFGACLSLDGIHPSPTGQAHVANAVIAAINSTYPEAELAPVTVP